MKAPWVAGFRDLNFSGYSNAPDWAPLADCPYFTELTELVPYGGYQNPAMTLLIKLTEPLLRPPRRWLPATAGIDLSPLVVLALLWIAIMAVRYFL